MAPRSPERAPGRRREHLDSGLDRGTTRSGRDPHQGRDQDLRDRRSNRVRRGSGGRVQGAVCPDSARVLAAARPGGARGTERNLPRSALRQRALRPLVQHRGDGHRRSPLRAACRHRSTGGSGELRRLTHTELDAGGSLRIPASGHLSLGPRREGTDEPVEGRDRTVGPGERRRSGRVPRRVALRVHASAQRRRLQAHGPRRSGERLGASRQPEPGTPPAARNAVGGMHWPDHPRAAGPSSRCRRRRLGRNR